jgi:alkylation response protein AidB-like acyl-CoA dehydrogenase
VVLLGVVTLTPNYSYFAITYADVKIHIIFEGSYEIQQLVIARAIFGLRIE